MMNAPSRAHPEERMSSPLLIVISAPSGGGKTTLCRQLIDTTPGMSRAITCTTRPPRAGEGDGVDYFFLDAKTFARRIEAGEFLEHATVFGNQYGTLKSEVRDKLSANQDVLLNIDVQGASAIRARSAEDSELKRALLSVFLTPATISVLKQRLRGRGTDPEDVIQRRLKVARTEIAEWVNFDYLIISTTVSEDLRRMQVVLEAERMRQHRARAPEL